MGNRMFNIHFKNGNSITVDEITKTEIVKDIKAMDKLRPTCYAFAEYLDGLLIIDILEVSHIVVKS